jgi:hypothetical protein
MASLKRFRQITNGFARGHNFNFSIIDWRDPDVDSKFLGNLLGAALSPIQTLFCSSTNLPSKTIETEAVPVHYGMPGIKVAKNVNYGSWTVTFYADEVLMLRFLFLRWMELIQDSSTQQFALASRYKSSFAFASILTPQNIPIQVYSFKGLFPTSVGSVTMAQQNSGSVLTFDVTFEFDFFTVNKDGLAFLASMAHETIMNGGVKAQTINLPYGATIKSPF